MHVQLRKDPDAASPLMVIATFVLVASGVTALLFFAFVDMAPASLSLEQADLEGSPGFRVVATHGDLDWEGLQVQFIDPAGVDKATHFLALPNGTVDPQDAIRLRTVPPPGQYHLRVFRDGAELERLLFEA